MYLNQTNYLPNAVEKYFRPSSNKTIIALVFTKLRIILRNTWWYSLLNFMQILQAKMQLEICVRPTVTCKYRCADFQETCLHSKPFLKRLPSSNLWESDHRLSVSKMQGLFKCYIKWYAWRTILLNRLTPNDPYMGRTAPLTSKPCILYIYSTNKGTEYFKHALYSPFFLFKKAVCFIMLTCLVPVLFTFYIQGVLKFKK